MNITEADDNQLIEELANRGIDVRHITETACAIRNIITENYNK